MTKPIVTAILLSYKRKKNMPSIIEAIRDQAIETEIWVINNDGLEDFGADKLIAIPWNAGEWARYVFARRIETDFGMFQDDDFMLGDNGFLEDALDIYMERCYDTGAFLGTAGRGLRTTDPYYSPDFPGNKPARVAILKGHFQLWNKNFLQPLHVPWHPSASDIYWSLDMSKGAPFHWVDSELKKRLVELPRYGVGYEFRPGHWRERNEVCKKYIDEYGVVI